MMHLQFWMSRWLFFVIPLVVLFILVIFSGKIPFSVGYRLCTAFSSQFAANCIRF
jgi:positive regulator of sigma E activity